MTEMDLKKKRLIDLLCQAHNLATDASAFGDATYAQQLEVEADHLIANGVFLLPCKIGDPVYVITYCRCANPECYDNQHCHKKETKRTPKVLASKMVQQMGWRTVWNCFGELDRDKTGWKPKGTICHKVYQKPFELKMLAEFGKAVFLTLEEAEAALAAKGAENE